MPRLADALLSLPGFYTGFQKAIGKPRNNYLSEHVRPQPGDRILDIGCGPAAILDVLPGVDYVGVDLSSTYIQEARRRFGNRGEFRCQPIETFMIENPGTFDIVMANGVVHHLDDVSAAKLFATARHALKPMGRLVTHDGCYVPGQSPIARWLLANDRGRHVRNQSQYLHLASNSFTTVHATVRHDLLRVPYTHLIMECSH